VKKFTPVLKQTSIAMGCYRPLRHLHRAFNTSERKHFREHRDLFAQFVGPGDLAFDVGANIGARTEIMLSLGAFAVAFEPQPQLAREVRARGNAKLLTVVESAVASEVGTAKLFLTSSSGMASLVSDWRNEDDRGELVVPVTTLNVEIAKYGIPAFCKIDVEGFEQEVLKGLSVPIRAISFEYHCDNRGLEMMASCIDLLMGLGKYEFNLTGTEEAKLLLPQWMSEDAFLRAVSGSAHFYGDIFARLTD
jgi:FkbM family methyltransferase